MSLRLGRLAGIDLRLHWSLPFGVLAFTGIRFEPVSAAMMVALILVHELGHAAVVRLSGAKVVEVTLSGLGGVCHWRGEVSPLGRAAISFGGVWAQLLVFGGGLFFRSELDARVAWVLIESNAWLMAVNLLPIAPLDGSQAWRLPILLGRSMRARLFTGRADQRLVDQLDAEFDAGARSDEVKSVVDALLEKKQ